jgi:hypothetical protein
MWFNSKYNVNGPDEVAASRSPANLTRRLTAMTIAHDAHPHDDTVEAHYFGLERLESPHACTDGVVYIGHLVEDPGTGEETEVVEAVPCRRCAGEDH